MTTKSVTWTRADRALLAIVNLIECADFADYDPEGRAFRELSAAAEAARRIRNQRPEPLGARNFLRGPASSGTEGNAHA
jgi:hypothetical protein